MLCPHGITCGQSTWTGTQRISLTITCYLVCHNGRASGVPNKGAGAGYPCRTRWVLSEQAAHNVVSRVPSSPPRKKHSATLAKMKGYCQSGGERVTNATRRKACRQSGKDVVRWYQYSSTHLPHPNNQGVSRSTHVAADTGVCSCVSALGVCPTSLPAKAGFSSAAPSVVAAAAGVSLGRGMSAASLAAGVPF